MQFLDHSGELYDNTDQNSRSLSEIESISDRVDDDEDVEAFAMDGDVSPFTPTEMYLSDNLENNDDALGFCIGVDENIIYRPHTNDPLYSVTVQDRLMGALEEMRLVSSGEYPAWVVYILVALLPTLLLVPFYLSRNFVPADM